MRATKHPLPSPTHRWLPQGAGWDLELAGDWRDGAPARLTPPPTAAQTGHAATSGVAVQAQALVAWDAGLAAALRDCLAPLARSGARLQLDSLPQDVRAVLALALPQARAAPGSGHVAG